MPCGLKFYCCTLLLPFYISSFPLKILIAVKGNLLQKIKLRWFLLRHIFFLDAMRGMLYLPDSIEKGHKLIVWIFNKLQKLWLLNSGEQILILSYFSWWFLFMIHSCHSTLWLHRWKQCLIFFNVIILRVYQV